MLSRKERALTMIAETRERKVQSEEKLDAWVYEAREQGASWREIADMLNLDRRTVWEKYSGNRKPRTDGNPS